MNLLLKERGVTTDYLLQVKEEKKSNAIKRKRREATQWNVKELISLASAKRDNTNKKDTILMNHNSPVKLKRIIKVQ